MPRNIGGVGGREPIDLPEPIPEPVATAAPAATSARRSVDDFKRWTTQNVAIAQDAPIATLNGLFNRSVYGSIRISGDNVTFTRRVFNQPEEPGRPLTAKEKEDLVASLERELAGPLPRGVDRGDFETFLNMLKEAGSDLPGPILTEAIGEMGRAVGDMVIDRLKTENDDGLQRTLRAFVGRISAGPRPPGQDYDLSSMLGALRGKGMLDDLAQELLVSEREFISTHPNVRYLPFSRQLTAAIEKYGSPADKTTWKEACASVEKKLGTSQKDGKAAGLEGAREIELGLDKGDREMVSRALGRLHEGILSLNPFMKSRLNALVNRLDEDGKLNDLVVSLKQDAGGKAACKKLGELIQAAGSQKTKAAWKAAGG